MQRKIVSILKNNLYSILNFFILVLVAQTLLVIRSLEVNEQFGGLARRLDEISQSQFRVEQAKHPSVTSNRDFNGEKTNFTFSPNKRLIAFIQNVFDEYDSDWDRYWALKVFDPVTGGEKDLVVDDTHMSSYVWLDSYTLRVFHSGGTGVRVYLDVSTSREAPLFTSEYEGPEIWTLDADYAQEAKDVVEARRIYLEYFKGKE